MYEQPGQLRTIRPNQTKIRVSGLEIGLLLVIACILASLAASGLLLLAGGIYAVFFLLLALARPTLAFMVIFAQAPLVWDLGGGPLKMAMADVSLVIASVVLIAKFAMSSRPVAKNPLNLPVAAYFGICLISTFLNGTITQSLASMLQMALYMGLTVFVFSNCVEYPEQLIPALYGILVTDAILSLVVLIVRSNYVLGLHKNAIGSELDYAVVIAMELWLARATKRTSKRAISVLLVVVGAGLLFSLSRGGWLGTIVGVLVLFVLHGRMKLAIRSALIITPIIIVCWMLLPQESKDYAVNFSSEARNIDARYKSVTFAWNFFKENPVLGVGVGLRKMYDATNVIMSTLAETGLAGLLTFMGIFAAMAHMVWKTCRRCEPGSTLFSISAIGGALMAAKFAHGCVDHYWSRVMLPVWACAGMAVYSYNCVVKIPRTKKAKRPSKIQGFGMSVVR